MPQPSPRMLNRRRSYGPRGGAAQHYDQHKYFAKSAPADGKCIIDIKQDSYPSHELDFNLYSAAFIIRQECLEKAEPPWGGVGFRMGETVHADSDNAKQLNSMPGEEGNLNLTIQAYIPPFTRCEGAPPARRPNHEACQKIINNIMKASTARTTFAVGGFPVPEPVERLPQTLAARLSTAGGGCTITIDTTAPEDTASWYDIWAAAVAVDGMCVRAGKTGRSRFLGTRRKLTVQITK
ncbi:MAG: hypothetical protein Q9221_008061 [Calogaya cf. arnoldii]